MDRLRTLGFGDFLRETRIAKNRTQTALAQQATEKLKTIDVSSAISQNAIAQYESEKIYPTLTKIVALAQVLELDYFALILRVAYSQFRQSAYQAESLAPELETELQASRLNLLLAALSRFPNIGSVESKKLELIQLQTKALIVSHAEVLGLEGVAEWQRSFPNLEEFWICNLYWLDAEITVLKKVTLHHLQNRECRYVYFVPPQDLLPKGKLTIFVATLSAELGFDVSPQIIGVPIREGDLRKVRLDFVVANPHKAPEGSVAFTNFRHGGASRAFSRDIPPIQYSFRMDQELLDRDIKRLQEFAKAKNLLIGSYAKRLEPHKHSP